MTAEAPADVLSASSLTVAAYGCYTLRNVMRPSTAIAPLFHMLNMLGQRLLAEFENVVSIKITLDKVRFHDKHGVKRGPALL